MENRVRGIRILVWAGVCAAVNKVIRGSLKERVIFKQRLEGDPGQQ